MWPFNLHYPSRNRSQHESIRPSRHACRPRRAVASLCLEPLEERSLLNAASMPTPAPTPPPPSQYQAVQSLFLDGAYLQIRSLESQFITLNPTNPDAPTNMANATAAAAAAGINLNAVQSVEAFLDNTQTALDLGNSSNLRIYGVTADLQFSWQYAGTLAPYAVTAGAQAALQAVQQ